jgi:hypothetical protein
VASRESRYHQAIERGDYVIEVIEGRSREVVTRIHAASPCSSLMTHVPSRLRRRLVTALRGSGDRSRLLGIGPEEQTTRGGALLRYWHDEIAAEDDQDSRLVDEVFVELAIAELRRGRVKC